jgi:hypothetical protein
MHWSLQIKEVLKLLSKKVNSFENIVVKEAKTKEDL